MASDEPQAAESVVPDCPHCGEELTHAQPRHSADTAAPSAAITSGDYVALPGGNDAS